MIIKKLNRLKILDHNEVTLDERLKVTTNP